jgi:CHAT domain-containing protein
VVDPSAAGPGPVLAGVDREVKQIAAIVSSAKILRGEEAHAAALTRYAADYPNVHLACHAIPNTTSWGPARMFLADGALRVSDIAGDRYPDHARLAYLSCCFAAADVVEPSEDPQHLAAAFQALGYRDVVGALWAASDRWAAKLAPRFYAELVAERGDAGDPVAGALHRALTSLREMDEDALFQAPFVHFTT